MGSQLVKTHQLSTGGLQEGKREMESISTMSKSLNDIFQCAEEHFAKEPDCEEQRQDDAPLEWGIAGVRVWQRGMEDISWPEGSEPRKPGRSLDSWEEMPKGLKTCFDCAIRGFQKKPPCVQENAKLVIQSNRRNLPFVSGKGKCEISVSYSNRKLVYTVNEPTGEVYLRWLGTRPTPMSVSSIVRA
ncbi:unnamed protein product [Caretta caretta]